MGSTRRQNSREVRGVAHYVRGLHLARTYQRAWLSPDLMAGLTVWAILVPQAMAYAELAGMPAATGRYTAFGALLL